MGVQRYKITDDDTAVYAADDGPWVRYAAHEAALREAAAARPVAFADNVLALARFGSLVLRAIWRDPRNGIISPPSLTDRYLEQLAQNAGVLHVVADRRRAERWPLADGIEATMDALADDPRAGAFSYEAAKAREAIENKRRIAIARGLAKLTAEESAAIFGWLG